MSRYLIVVDMQNDFIDGVLGSKEAVALLPAVLDKIQDYKGIVVATKDTHTNGYLATQEGKHLPCMHCIAGSRGHCIQKDIDEVIHIMNARVFEKNTFASLELAEYLAEENKKEPIEKIEIIGLCTDICVISNAFLLKAYLPEVPIAVDASCCAGVTPQSHKNALEAMKMCQIEIIKGEISGQPF